MGSVRLQGVTKQFGPALVLSGVDLELHTGQIVALVGANGVGKTTLLRLIAGQLAPDTGTVTRSKGLEVGYLPQEPDLQAGQTLREAVAEAFTELMAMEAKLLRLSEEVAAAHDDPRLDDLLSQYDRLRARFEAAGGYRFEQRLDEVLGGLGFTPADASLSVSALSGGQKCRAALARLLLQDRQFLLLDEPTNHLDIDAVRWLEKFLAGHHGGALIVSHDRYLLDRLAERTLECVAGGVVAYAGNYSAYVEARELRRLTQQRQYEKDQAFIAREQDYIARHGAAKRPKQARGRRTRLERRLEAGGLTTEKPAEQRTLSMRFAPPPRPTTFGRELVRLEGLRKAYGPKELFANLDLTVHAGQRLGITGPNGTGKTTLLRILLGQVPADAGSVYLNPAARVGYFAQEPEQLDLERTIVAEIIAVRPDLLERDARNVAAGFLFTGEDPFKKLGQLSGGEQSRLRFMKLILSAPELLILDEPTNHLDIPSREALEGALRDFPGTVIAVSHDRYFLDRIVDRLLVIRPGQARLFTGNYTTYIEQVERERAEALAAAAESSPPARGAPAKRSPARKPGAAPQPASPLARLKLDQLEAYISEREERLAALHERFGDAEVYRDPEKITRLRAEFDRLQEELATAEAEWIRRVDRA